MADYFVEGGEVLKNKLGITAPVDLKEAEENAFANAASEITAEGALNQELDFAFLKNLHKRLFGRVYPFAGKIRTVNITKPDSDIPFCMADFIALEADRIFSELKVNNYLKGLPKEKFIDSLAELAIELNALHPFREGNGRTIRLYLQLLADNAGYFLSYDWASHDEIIAADKRAFLGNDTPIKQLYAKIVLPVSEDDAAKML